MWWISSRHVGYPRDSYGRELRRATVPSTIAAHHRCRTKLCLKNCKANGVLWRRASIELSASKLDVVRQQIIAIISNQFDCFSSVFIACGVVIFAREKNDGQCPSNKRYDGVVWYSGQLVPNNK